MISEQDLISHYRQCVGPLYSYVSKRTGGDRALTEDLVQETWLRALSDWCQKGLPREPIAWLKKVSSNLLMSHYRHMKHQVTPHSELLPDNDSTAAQSPEVATMLHIALDKLRPRHAWLIEAFHFDGKGVAEIAGELGISERAAEGRMRRAREALKAQLGTQQS